MKGEESGFGFRFAFRVLVSVFFGLTDIFYQAMYQGLRCLRRNKPRFYCQLNTAN